MDIFLSRTLRLGVQSEAENIIHRHGSLLTKRYLCFTPSALGMYSKMYILVSPYFPVAITGLNLTGKPVSAHTNSLAGFPPPPDER